ncbi:hypothetical protein PIB30_076134 [Stylosanthes scabra]|uniref:Putative plant transposon protein domain-containing protein n=1 Tax=Stylosanthes scabra TaxID=79078 RepID=A0ABU6ZNV1_9FABA|nr:hypothetical protein [Stylosanthes scabra]
MASKGKGIARQPSARTRGTSSRRQPSQEAERFETPNHAERGNTLSERKVIHERTINGNTQDTFREQIFVRGGNSFVPINMSLIRDFYANHDKKNQHEIYVRGIKISCHYRDIQRVLHIPRLEGKNEYNELGEDYDDNKLDLDAVIKDIGKDGATWPDVPGKISKTILNKEAWMSMKLVVCNIVPTRHETTLGVDHILLIYALMKGMTISLPGVMVSTMDMDPTKSKKHLLPFPMFITKWAEEAKVPTYPGDEMLKIPKGQQFFPYRVWKEETEAAANPIPPPLPSPVAHIDILTSCNVGSPEPSWKELMRALKRNERVMRRHEQLLLLIHPGTYISQLEQISSLEVFEH